MFLCHLPFSQKLLGHGHNRKAAQPVSHELRNVSDENTGQLQVATRNCKTWWMWWPECFTEQSIHKFDCNALLLGLLSPMKLRTLTTPQVSSWWTVNALSWRFCRQGSPISAVNMNFNQNHQRSCDMLWPHWPSSKLMCQLHPTALNGLSSKLNAPNHRAASAATWTHQAPPAVTACLLRASKQSLFWRWFRAPTV